MHPYSCINSYNYLDKPKFISMVDWITSPIRGVFEGRTIDLISWTEEVPTKSWMHAPYIKVATIVGFLVASVVFPALGVFFTTSVILKVSCCLWEKKKVSHELNFTSEIIRKFEENYANQKYIEALQVLEERPELASRWKEELLIITKELAKSEANHEHLSNLSQLYSSGNDDSLTIFKHVIETKFKHDMLGYDIKQIEELAQELKLSNEETLIYYLSILHLFKIEDGDDYTIKMIKLNIGSGIINILQSGNKTREEEELDKSTTENSNSANLAHFDANHIRITLLEKLTIDKSLYLSLLNDPQSCLCLSSLVSSIREIKNIEENIKKIKPKLDKKSIKTKNLASILKFKKKVITNGKLILERIENVHFLSSQHNKDYPPSFCKDMVRLIEFRYEKIGTYLEYYKEPIKSAEKILNKFETNQSDLEFNLAKFKLSLNFLKNILEDTSSAILYNKPKNILLELYNQYYTSLKAQFSFIDTTLELISACDDLAMSHRGSQSVNDIKVT